MGREARAHALPLALVLAALLSGIGARGLTETSEGRYGSIAAEMARSGDWLIPRLNGVEHFEKPPLAVWAMALSLRSLGESEAALRFPGVLAALVAVASACVLARGPPGRLASGPRSRRGTWAAILTLASPLFFALAQIATTDIYLAACSAAALAFAARSIDSGLAPDARARCLTAATAASALGFLVKGPVIWILALGPILLEALWSRDAAILRGAFSAKRVALFAAIALPWFLAAGWKTPGLLGWFLRERSIGALTSSKGFHPGSVLYYVPVLAIGFLPASWLLVSLSRGGWRELLAQRTDRLMLCALVLPLVVLSMSASKLPTYVLPLCVPAAVLAARALERGLGRWGVLAASLFLAALAAAGAVAAARLGGFARFPVSARWLSASALVAAGLGSVGAGLLALRRQTIASCAVLVAGVLAALLLCVPAVGQAESQIIRSGSGREIARTLGALAADGRPILGYRCFVRSLPFYTRRRILLADFYVPDVSYARGLPAVDVRGPEALARVFATGPVAVLCRARQRAELEHEVGPLLLVKEIGKYAILANAPGGAGEN